MRRCHLLLYVVVVLGIMMFFNNDARAFTEIYVNGKRAQTFDMDFPKSHFLFNFIPRSQKDRMEEAFNRGCASFDERNGEGWSPRFFPYDNEGREYRPPYVMWVKSPCEGMR